MSLPHPCASAMYLLTAAVLGATTLPNHGATSKVPGHAQYQPGIILAKPRADHRATIARDESAEGLRVRQVFARFGDIRVIELPGAEPVDDAVKRLQATGRYEFVEPDFEMRHEAVPADPSFALQWSLNNTAQASGYVAGADIKAEAGWSMIHDAPDVVVAIVDGGVRIDHQDIAPNLWHNPAPTFGDLFGAAFVNGVRSTDLSDIDGHGTHVAGIICAAGNNGLNIAGVAWKTQLMVLKNARPDGTMMSSDSAACIDYAIANGAKVINCSFGGTGFSQTLYAACKAARDAGVIIVCAAGNDGTDNDSSPHYPSNYLLDNIVAVGNSTPADTVSTSSDYGERVELFAPGTSILSLDGSNVTGLVYMSGTSMAAPHVTGALALLREYFPADTYLQLINRLLRGTEYKTGFAGRALTNGRLNLYYALTAPSNRPFNDDFMYRSLITGFSVSLRANDTGATTEVAEPAHANGAATRSLWWQWIAPASGNVTIDTTGSEYDTVIDVYTGPDATTDLTALVPLVANDDDGAKTTSRVTFNVTALQSYFIAVSAKNGAQGYAQLNIAIPPANDNFANAFTLTGNTARDTAINTAATAEPGEPRILDYPGGASVWYKWTAPKTGRFQISAFTYDFDAILAVYTGSALNSLTLVAADDDTNTGTQIANTDSRCTIDATAGTTYYIQVDTTTTSLRGTVVTTITDSAWQLSTQGLIDSAPAVTADGTIYVGTSVPDGRLYAVAPDGSLKWVYATNGMITNTAPSLAADGTIYQGSTDGNLVALKPDGTVRWSHYFGTSSAAYIPSPAIGSDGTLYLHAGDGFLYALSPVDGSAKWHYNTASTNFASAVVAADGTIYQGSDGNQCLYALNPDGTLKWSYATGGTTYSTPALDAGGNIYFATYSNSQVISLTPAGTSRWTYNGVAATNSLSSSPVLSPDGSTAYIGAADGKLYALDAATGTARWTYACADSIYGCTPAVDANGVIYIGAYDGTIYAVNASGGLVRTWDTAGVVRSSPALFGTRMYVGSYDTKLYAIDIGASAAVSPWPQYRWSAQRQGRAVTIPLAITTAPQSGNIALAGSLSLSVAATGQPPLTYQWNKDGAAITGATAATYTISNATTASAGVYTVTVTGPQGSVTSPAATVTVQTAPLAITTAPQSTNVALNGSATLGVVATGQAPLAYQWSKDGAAIAGATASTYVIANAGAASAGTYTVTISGPQGSITSTGATVGVLTPDVARLANLSIRTAAGTGSQTLIVGLTVGRGGAGVTKPLLVRAVGPTLGAIGVGGALVDPVLTILRQQDNTFVVSNDGWRNDPQIAAIGQKVAAFPMQTDSVDAALYRPFDAMTYSVEITGKSGTGVALAEVYDATPADSFTTTTPRLVNISARTQVGTGNDVLIAGFNVSGSAERLLIRAVGGTLADIGVGGALLDPKLELYNQTTGAKITENDNWGGGADLVAAAQSVAAFPLTSANDSVLMVTLAPGTYSAVVRGVNDTTGVALIELYELP